MLIRVACFLVALLGSGSLVIAETGDAGLTAVPESGTGAGWTLAWAVAALGSLAICLRLGLLGPGSLSRPASPIRTWHPLLFLIVFFAALALQTASYSIAHAVLTQPATETESMPLAPVGGEAAVESSLRRDAILTASSQASALVLLLVLLWLMVVRLGTPTRGGERGGSRRRGRSPPLPVVGAGLVALVLVYPIAQVAGLLGAAAQQLLTGEPPELLSHTTLRQLADAERAEVLWVGLIAATVVLVVPIVEEIMYRFGLQGSIARAAGSRWLAILATACIFAVLHLGAVPPAALPALVVLGIGFGVVYERTGSLASAVVMHAGFNAVNLLALLLI